MSEPLPRGDELIAEQQFSASMQDELEAFRAHHLAETSRLTKELLELRADVKALVSIVEGVSKQKWNMGVAAELAHSALATLNAREALATSAPLTCHICGKPLSQPGEPYCSAFHATPAPVVPPAMHASAPPEHKCSDCTIDQEPCPTCYEAWWKKKHPHHHLIEPPTVPLADAEALATALEKIACLGVTISFDDAQAVIAAFRAKRPPAEAKETP